MGGSKLPDLQVLRPKGTAKCAKANQGQIPETPEPTIKKGDKRIWSQDQEEQRPEKRTRERSPVLGGSQGSQWMGRPTFLTKEELEAKRSPVSKNPEPDPDPETRTTTDPMGKTRVKERVEKLNMRTQNSPGKFPAAKQSLIHVYFTRKSPKAKQAREKKLKITETENTELQGALKSPLSGDVGYPGPSTIPSLGPGPAREEKQKIYPQVKILSKVMA